MTVSEAVLAMTPYLAAWIRSLALCVAYQHWRGFALFAPVQARQITQDRLRTMVGTGILDYMGCGEVYTFCLRMGHRSRQDRKNLLH